MWVPINEGELKKMERDKTFISWNDDEIEARPGMSAHGLKSLARLGRTYRLSLDDDGGLVVEEVQNDD